MNILFKITILVFSISPLCAYEAQENFLRANKHYDEKEFSDAYTLYQSMEQKDAAVLYNMGNCSYKLGNSVDALACWHRAHKKAPADLMQSISFNIAVAEEKLGVNNETGLKKMLAKLLAHRSLFGLQILFLFLWFALFFFIKKYNRGTKYRMFFLIFLLSCTISSGAFLILKYHSVTQHKGIVMKSDVSIFAGPDEQYHSLATMQQAEYVLVADQRDQWYKIKYKNITGWVMKDALAVV